MNNLMIPYNDAMAEAMEAYFKGSPATLAATLAATFRYDMIYHTHS